VSVQTSIKAIRLLQTPTQQRSTSATRKRVGEDLGRREYPLQHGPDVRHDPATHGHLYKDQSSGNARQFRLSQQQSLPAVSSWNLSGFLLEKRSGSHIKISEEKF
jgi:hypothetical protein